MVQASFCLLVLTSWQSNKRTSDVARFVGSATVISGRSPAVRGSIPRTGRAFTREESARSRRERGLDPRLGVRSAIPSLEGKLFPSTAVELTRSVARAFDFVSCFLKEQLMIFKRTRRSIG
jgi:hypothetical protein